MAEIIKDLVKESSATTGTGPFAVSGADVGFRTFGSVCSVGDTFRCSAVADDGSWQVGIGRYSAANEVTFDSVVDSSNSGSPVSFAAGTKKLFIGMDAAKASWIRERLTAARTYYVRTDGSDSNTGLVNSAGGAFLTIQKAVNTIQNSLDTNGFDVTIQVADGTHTSGAVFREKIGAGDVYLTGNAATPANCVISTTSSDCLTAFRTGYAVNCGGFKLQTTTSGRCIRSGYFATVTLSGAMEFGSCASDHVYCDNGGVVFVNANYSITGNAVQHLRSDSHGTINTGSRTITVSSSLTFTYFALAQSSGVIYVGGTAYSNTTATGTRYLADRLGLINWSGTAVTFPGSVAGSTANGGIAA